MAVKHKTAYLFLTLACFVGIILIFIFDGYIGLYDSLVMDNGQYEQTIEPDRWGDDERYGYLQSTGVERNGTLEFTYTVENHRFSGYAETVEITYLHNREPVGEPLMGTMEADSFSKVEMMWMVPTADLVPTAVPSDQNYNVNMLIKRGEVTREILINIYPSPVALKTPVVID